MKICRTKEYLFYTERRTKNKYIIQESKTDMSQVRWGKSLTELKNITWKFYKVLLTINANTIK